MTSKTGQVIALTAALLTVPFVAGCGNNTTNETGPTGPSGAAPPNSPKTQQEFYDQMKAQAKAGKPGARSGR